MRNPSKLCHLCHGQGRRMYPNSATYKSGPDVVSQRVVTFDTCDLCWGTGDSWNPGENLLEKDQT